DGRLILGLGIANQTIAGWHGDRYERPLRRIREYIDILRATYAGGRVEYTGDIYSSTGGFKLAFEPSHPLRIWLAALGPQMSKLAGALSDGIIVNMANPQRVRQIAAWFHEGARSAGRDPAELQVVAELRLALPQN